MFLTPLAALFDNLFGFWFPPGELTATDPEPAPTPRLAEAVANLRRDIRNTVSQTQGRKADAPALIIVVDHGDLEVVVGHVEAELTREETP